MTEQQRETEPTAIFRNVDCPICTGQLVVQPAEEESRKRSAHKEPIAPHVVTEFRLFEPRHPDWELELYLHGRRQQTAVQRVWMRLHGTSNYPHEDHHPALVKTAKTPFGDITHVNGALDDPEDPRTFRRNIIRVGGFLSLANKGVVGIQCRMPVVHIIASYNCFE